MSMNDGKDLPGIATPTSLPACLPILVTSEKPRKLMAKEEWEKLKKYRQTRKAKKKVEMTARKRNRGCKN
jgi:hypothetical protein